MAPDRGRAEMFPDAWLRRPSRYRMAAAERILVYPRNSIRTGVDLESSSFKIMPDPILIQFPQVLSPLLASGQFISGAAVEAMLEKPMHDGRNLRMDADAVALL